MLTARRVVPAGQWDATTAIDRVTLDHDARHRRRFAYTADGGTPFLLTLERATVLQDGDGLELADGRLIAVRAADEPLMAVRATSDVSLPRLAWHIGNRHLPAQISADAILLRRDHVIQAMLEGLGAQVVLIEAPFAPEAGAYAEGLAAHHAHHEHDHEHAHGRG
jgi:urease accessory protein